MKAMSEKADIFIEAAEYYGVDFRCNKAASKNALIKLLEEQDRDTRNACAKKDERIQELERAVSVLTGSNPDWRYNVSNGDVSIIDKILEKLNAWSE